MVGLPDAAQAQALSKALCTAGWPTEEVLNFTPRESVDELAALIDNADGMAGFGYEITLMRRYLKLSRLGVRWLLVKADSTDRAAQAADLARAHGALLAVHYRMLTVEELI